MPNDELTKHTLNLFEGDYRKIQEFYPELGAAVIIRKVIRSFIEQIEANGSARIESGVEINI